MQLRGNEGDRTHSCSILSNYCGKDNRTLRTPSCDVSKIGAARVEVSSKNKREKRERVCVCVCVN
jgi:hypothetical protein